MTSNTILFVLFQELGVVPDGGDQCNKRNIDLVNDICGKDNVEFFYIRKKLKTTIRESLNFLFYLSRGFYRGITPKIIDSIYEKSQNKNVVFLSSSLFGSIAKGLRERGYQGRIITQFHNVETAYYSVVITERLPLKKKIIRCISRNEVWASMYSDSILALNQRDATEINKLASHNVDYIIPITLEDKFDLRIQNKEFTQSKPLVTFIGSNFPPNADGVLWFVRNVLPYVNINFLVVGKDMDKLKKENAELRNIEVLSNVPDIKKYFLEADVIVCPIFSGSGMKVKTCEALMFGKNILGSTEAFEGYELDYDKAGRKADSAQEYIDYLNGISEKPIPRFNDYSRNVYVTKYSNEVAKDIFKKILV